LGIEKTLKIGHQETMHEAAAPETCRNCGTALKGEYCHCCGQSAATVRRPARELFHDVAGNLLQWDSRLVRTLRILLFHPGKLSTDWVDGLRARYVPPFRLYIIASFILFLLVGVLARQGDFQVGTIRVHEESLVELEKAVDEARANGEWLVGLFLQASLEAVRDPASYIERLLGNLPKAAFLLLPAFALLHMGVNIRQDRYYIDHLVFSLHFHTFAFLLFAAVLLLGRLPWGIGVFADLLNLSLPLYAVVSFRNFNQQGWAKSVLKASIAFGAYSVFLTIGVAIYFSAVLFF
jgi:hypothetical protein